MLTIKVSDNKTISDIFRPRTIFSPVIQPMANTAGIVNPIVANAELKEMFTARYSRLSCVAWTALISSSTISIGNKITAFILCF